MKKPYKAPIRHLVIKGVEQPVGQPVGILVVLHIEVTVQSKIDKTCLMFVFSVILFGAIIGVAGQFKGWQIGVYGLYPLI